MFSNVAMRYDNVNDVYTVNGIFGTNFRNRAIRKLSLKKIEALFIKFGFTGFSFYGFFAPEVIYVIELLISGGSVYGVNVGALKTFLKEIKAAIHYDDIITLDTTIIDDKMKFKILEDQQVVFDKYSMNKNKSHYRGLLLDMGTGTGKALRNDTLVKIPAGWRCIGNLKVGDAVIGNDGLPTYVKGVYPQGIVKLQDVIFEDDRSIPAAYDHLWKIYLNSEDLTRPTLSDIITTEAIANLLSIPGNRLYIDLIEPEDTEPIDYEIDPYVMGMIANRGIVGDDYIFFPAIETMDVKPYVKTLIDNEKAITLGKIGYELKQSVIYEGNCNRSVRVLAKLDYQNPNFESRFIPDEYKKGSIEQRWSYLQGVFDTAELFVNDEYLVYTTKSSQLAKDIQEVIWSLGGIAKITHTRSTYKLHFKHSKPYMFFKNSTNITLLDKLTYSGNKLYLEIKQLKTLEDDEATCIKVDNDSSLFVVENYIVTHNTFTSLAILECLQTDVNICIVPNKSVKTVWINGLVEQYKDPQSNYVIMDNRDYNNEKYIISNYENISKVMELLPLLKGRKIGIIVDEVHNFLERSSLRTSGLLTLIDDSKSDDVVLLSGTTIKSGVAELAVLISMLDRRFKGMVEKRFMGIYRNPGDVFKKTLQMRYGDFSVKVTKENIEYKPIIRNVPMTLTNGVDYTLPVIANNLKEFFKKRTAELKPLLPKYSEVYEALYNKAKELGLKDGISIKAYIAYENNVKEVISAYRRKQLMFASVFIKETNSFEKNYIIPYLESAEKKIFREAKTIHKYPSLKIQGEALAGVIGKARIECHRDMANYFDFDNIIESTDKKTIVFSSYIEVCDAVINNVKAKKYTPIGVYGDTTKHLNEYVGKYIDIPKFNPLVSTYKSLGESVPLVVANIIVIMDTPFRMYIYDQAIARVWRRGQDTQTYVYIPLLDTGTVPNINSRNINIINFFKEEVEKITGYSYDIGVIESADDLNIAVEEYKEIKPLSNTSRLGLESTMINW